MSLTCCPTCSRHVRAADRACPFCAAAIAAPPFLAMGRLALGSLVVAGAVTGCPAYGVAAPVSTPTPQSSASSAPLTSPHP